MVLEQLTLWLTETETLVQTLMQLYGEVAQLQGARTIAQAVNNGKQVAQTDSNLTLLRTHIDMVEKQVFLRTGSLALESASTLVQDLQIRLQRTRELFVAWRKMIALQEFAEATGQFEGGDEEAVTREQAANACERAKVFYETQLALTNALLPAAATTAPSRILTL